MFVSVCVLNHTLNKDYIAAENLAKRPFVGQVKYQVLHGSAASRRSLL